MPAVPKLVPVVPPPHPPLAPEERMYIDIYDAIMEHRLPAGTKLTEQALGEIYGLARHNVRRVLARLAADGVVDIERNRGACIASPGEREAQDMFELRQVLEAKVMDKLAGQLGDADYASLRRLIDEERDAYMRGDRPLWIRLSANFHIELAKLAGNQLLVEALRRLVSRTTLLISTVDSAGQQPCSFDEHKAVVDALRDKDRHRAQQEMARHLDQCACRMMARGSRRFDLRTALGKPNALGTSPVNNI
ncbi:GntR family transcriptional regulator [Noviherbaspirillum aridicola]|nr:GntR family transcriptional regulator [Noviherbaspirillum aridicola]